MDSRSPSSPTYIPRSSRRQERHRSWTGADKCSEKVGPRQHGRQATGTTDDRRTRPHGEVPSCEVTKTTGVRLTAGENRLGFPHKAADPHPKRWRRRLAWLLPRQNTEKSETRKRRL